MSYEVSDIELTIPDRKPVDPTLKRAIPVPGKTKRKEPSGHNGKCAVRKVSEEEMEKQWV